MFKKLLLFSALGLVAISCSLVKEDRITKLTGAMYTNSSTGGSFQLTTDWETEYSGIF